MAETAFRGPLLNLGAMLDTSSSPFDGPNMSYQGGMLIDPRNGPAAKDSMSPGALPGFLMGNQFQVIDQIPSITNASTVAAAQIATAAVAVTLATTAPGGSAAGVPSWAPGVPIIPTNTTVPVTVSAIDFGFTTGTTVANSSTVVVVDSTLLQQGQWIVIGGAGNSGKTASLVTQVASVANATTIQISPVALGSLSHAPIGQGNLFNNNLPPASQFGPAAASASAAVPYRVAGFGLAFDPVQAIARNITIAAASVEGGTAAIVVTGYDIYGVPMTELLTATGTTLVGGKKAFKYVASIAATVTGSSTITVGIGDIVGLPLRADRFTQMGEVIMGNNIMATAAGFTTAITSAANNTSGDVRGTLALNLLGGAIGTSNGTSRLGVTMAVPLLSLLNATPSNSTSMFGVAQA